MLLSQIKNQRLAIALLQNGLRKRTLAHAYIFSGPKGTGKLTAALALAKGLFCTEKKGEGCYECVACRKVLNRNHASLYMIEPDGSSIKIEQIRELKRRFSYRQDGMDRQVYIIQQAEKMTIQAANGLLKFFEEPQTEVVAILISENGQAILPTLRSRSQWVPFVPLAPVDMEQQLTAAGYPLTLVRPAVRLHSGMDSAKETIESNEFAEVRNVVIQLMKECLAGEASASILAQQKLFKSDLREHIETVLDLLALFLKDMLLLQYGQERMVIFIDQMDWMAPQARRKPVAHWIHSIDRVALARKRLRLHVQPQLALEQVMFYIKGGVACTQS